MMDENKNLNEELQDDTLEVISEEVVEEKPVITTTVKTILNVDYRTLKSYNIYYMKHVRHIQLIYIILIAIAVVFGVFSFLKDGNAGIPIIMGFFTIYMVYSLFTFDKQIDKQLKNHFLEKRPLKQEYTFTNVGFNVHTEGREDVEYEWAYVSKVHILKDFYFMFLGKQPLIIDRNPELIVSGSVEELDNIVAEVCKTKPVKRFEKPLTKKPITFDYPDYDEMDRYREEQLAAIRAEEEAEAKALEDNPIEDLEELNAEEAALEDAESSFVNPEQSEGSEN